VLRGKDYSDEALVTSVLLGSTTPPDLGDAKESSRRNLLSAIMPYILSQLIGIIRYEHVKKTKDFRYELFWMKADDFLERVKKAWLCAKKGKDRLSSFILKLMSVKDSLKGWGVNLRGSQIKKN
jgi:hypothetical protein